jgi:hypothetical protein
MRTMKTPMTTFRALISGTQSREARTSAWTRATGVRKMIQRDADGDAGHPAEEIEGHDG